MLKNPRLYEINTRVWIRQFGTGARLKDVPAEYFRDLRKKGFDIVWLMGIWKTCPAVIKNCCYSVDLISSYNKSLRDWNDSDVIGSPYSIDDYIVNPGLGSESELASLREMLHNEGLKLIVDYIPNHFSADTHLLSSIPGIFLPGDEELLKRDGYTFFRHGTEQEKIFAHGRDPLFPPWTDTVQVNYFSPEAREFMTDKLLKLSEIVDGVRCDMAMLPLNNVFHNTWIGVINRFRFEKPQCEFWKSAIETVKMKNPEFILLGEVYWDLEWNMQQLGFDYTYDKRLTERLTYNDVPGIKGHLSADSGFQRKSVRFLENHDETRAVTRFGKMRSLAAATVITTVQGMKFYYDGQLEGRKIKIPLQLGRQPEEKVSRTVSHYYNLLFEVTNMEIFRNGEWSLIEPVTAGSTNLSFYNFLAWTWKLGKEHVLVVINYSEDTSQCRIRFRLEDNKDEIILKDLLTGENYKRNIYELNTTGLFIELKAFQSHIFHFITE